MYGNPTNDCYFLDTCVYVNYGVPQDIYHEEAKVFFSNNYAKHTSDSVIAEIGDFKSFMSKFGRDLNKALGSKDRKWVFKNPWLVFIDYNSNQRNFIEKFLKVVVGRPPLKISEEYRILQGLVLDRINEALSKTNLPFLPLSNNNELMKQIAYVQDIGDIQIIADAALWASQFSSRRFCTSDKEHIINNKNDLELDITKNYGHNCLVFIHLENA